MIQIVESPRDAMQGISKFISTKKKIDYINSLLKVGYHTIDFGSFVSPKFMPQMRDSEEVLSNIEIGKSNTKLLSIVANKKGADLACSFNKIDYLGFPFSVSEIFQKKNTNKTIDQSLVLVDKIQNLCLSKNKKLVIYLSMAFGNPYGEKWNNEIVFKWTEKIVNMDIEILSLSDTIGSSGESSIKSIFSILKNEFSNVVFGAHFHTKLNNWKEKVESAFSSGCERFDTAILGYGGCPMVNNKMIGNLPTEKLITFLNEKKISHDLNLLSFESAYNSAIELFK